MVSSEVFDDKKLNNINQNLKLKDLDDYDLNLFYEYDDSLSVEDNVVRKFILKEKGKSFKKHLYDDAIDFYKKLIDNSYFVNDYYPYRHLAITYNRTKQPSHLLDTIKKFFKSGIYANTCQVNWFLYKLRDLESQNLITNDEIDELLEYYENHGFLNKHKENEPTVLSDRIFQRRNGTIEIDTQYGYDKQQHKYEIKEKGRWLERCNLFEDALELYWEQVQTTATGASDYYQRLAIIYERMHEFENELYVLTLFYKQRYHIVGKSTKKYFQNRLDKVNQGLRTSYTVEDFLNDNVNINNENDDIQVKSASNDELLFNDGPSEPDIPTKFNDNSFEQVMSNEVNENHLEIPFITIAGTNLTKLLKRNVVDIIIVQYYNDNVWLEIVDIHNPNHVYKESNSDNLKFTVIRENFEILKSLNEGELITFKTKGQSQEVVLKKVTEDIRKNRFIKDLEKTRSTSKSCNNLNSSDEEFNSWISKDKWDVEPYASFLTKVERIILEDKKRHQFPHTIKNKHKKRSKNQKNSKEKVREKVFADFVSRYVSHFESTPKAYLNDEHLKLIDLATECIGSNELNVAMDYYDEIINQYPNFEVLNKKGFLLIQLDEFEMAINCFDKSLEYQMKNNFYAHIGKSLAISNLLRLYECNPDQIDWDNKFESMKNHCNVACLIDNGGYIYKAKILNVLGHYNNAIEVIDDMLNKETLEIKLYYSALLEKSFSFRKWGKYYQAIGCYDELLKLDENNVNILLNKAEILFILKRYKDSINVFNLVLQLDSNNIDALMYLGVIYQIFNNFDEALLNFDRILKIDSSFHNALIYKAQLLVDLHRYDEAIICFDKCGDKLSADYQKLFKFAKEEAQQNNQTDYYAVTKTDFANFKYVYTYVDNGLRKIYGEDLEDLKIKVLDKSRLWMNMLNENLLDIPASNENPVFAIKFIQNYYNDELSGYDGLISLILNNEFLEKLDHKNLDLNELINSKKGIERDIIMDLVYTMNQKLNFVHNTNITGHFGVITQNKSDGTRWSYLDLVKKEYVNTRVIYAKTLDELEEKVKSENSLWYIFDEVLAKESQKRDNVNSSKKESTEKFSQNNLKNVITVGSNNFNTLIKSNIGDEIIAQIVNNSYKFIKLQIVDIQNRKIVENFTRNVIKISEENFNFIENLRSGELITIKSKRCRGKVILKLYDDKKSTKDIEIKSFKKQIEDNSTIYKESPVDKHVNETSKSTVKYILDISLPDKYELDLDNPFGFDSNLSDEDNIKMKFILKDNGNYLTKEKLYDDAIEYYECLKNNSYFENDWYPYRQLAMIFEKKGKHEENIENIKQLFFSGIYCNGYQYIWFIHKLNNALVYVEIEEIEIGTWLDYYNEHGAKNENKLDTPIFIADRIVKQDNKIKVYSKQMFYNNYQKLSEFKEKVRFSEQIGDYESALEAIRLYYQEYYSKIAHKDTMWFRRKLKIVNKELGTNYNYTDFI